VRALRALTAAILALGAGPVAEPAHFSASVPEGTPSVLGWERIAGELEVASPHVLLQYEFYVNPERQAAFEVVRYRITDLGAVPEGRRFPATEKLQWDLDGRDLRRWECVPHPDSGCRWREMGKDSLDYAREVPVILWIYGQYRRVMNFG
jgi:hypothetical protein